MFSVTPDEADTEVEIELPVSQIEQMVRNIIEEKAPLFGEILSQQIQVEGEDYSDEDFEEEGNHRPRKKRLIGFSGPGTLKEENVNE